MPNIQIKAETLEDYQSIYRIHEQAFGRKNESELINNLRKSQIFDSRLSLVAFHNSEPVGHILFYPLSIKTDYGLVPTLGLVPLSVKPRFHKQGVGSRLVKAGLRKAKELGYKSVVLAGSPDYYERFGFKLVNCIKNNIGEPIDHFLYIELKPDALKNVHGIIEYPAEFRKL